jgi:hypothetical protein
MSAVAELRAAQNDQGQIVTLPVWGRVEESDMRYRTHQWAKKTDPTHIPCQVAQRRFTLKIPARGRNVQHAESRQPEAGPSNSALGKRPASHSPSPSTQGKKRPRPAPASRRPMRANLTLTDTDGETGDEDRQHTMGKGKGKCKAKESKTPVKVSSTSFFFTHH